MKIKWYGHSAFRLAVDSGEKIIIDPYESGAFGGSIGYGAIKDAADIVLTSHDHGDHNYTRDIEGKFAHIKSAGEYEEKGLKIKAIPTYHDKSKGKERGNNLIFVIYAEDLAVAHLGDLGHILDESHLRNLGKIDVMLLPIGGFFTIDAKDATKIMDDVKPAITIPMHYRTDKANMPIEGVDAFIRDKKNVKETDASEIVITKTNLPKENEIILLRHAL